MGSQFKGSVSDQKDTETIQEPMDCSVRRISTDFDIQLENKSRTATEIENTGKRRCIGYSV